MSEFVLEIDGMSAGYGPAQVLHDISLRIPMGGVTCLLGANGAGKTTMLRAICAMTWRTGVIKLSDEDVGGKSTEQLVRLGLAHVPDGRGTFVSLTVEENLRVGGYLIATERLRRRRIAWVYDMFERLRERRAQQAGTLSGGEQQMLAIGRALMCSPRLLLLDEPSFGLAPIVVKDLFKTMSRINEETGMSILVVEQNARLALDICRDAYVLEAGAITLNGSSKEVTGNEAIRRAYLGTA
jgi:branched-chain amino acid transport system ATP-binding protein